MGDEAVGTAREWGYDSQPKRGFTGGIGSVGAANRLLLPEFIEDVPDATEDEGDLILDAAMLIGAEIPCAGDSDAKAKLREAWPH